MKERVREEKKERGTERKRGRDRERRMYGDESQTVNYSMKRYLTLEGSR